MSIRTSFFKTTAFLFSFMFCYVTTAATLDSLVIKQEGGKTSIIGMLAGSFTYKAFKLTNPDRVVIDVDQATTRINISKLPIGKGLIAQARSGHPTPQTLRLVFDVKQMVGIKTTSWKSANGQQRGLRIDLLPQAGVAKTALNKTPVTQTSTIHTALTKAPVQVKSAPPRSLRNVIIVLDPGHGGKDPGARGPMHNVEKNVVLAIAKRLKQQIDQQPGMHAVLTRNGDYYVGLRERLNIARKYNADVFVSIHADAFINQHSNGASVFALSQTGATSEAARWLAEKENYSELGGVNLSGLDDQNGVIRTVLIDLSQTATIGASLQMGNRVLRSMDKITNLHNNNVEQARFVVLKSPDIPSILVETGFITNPREEKNLSSAYYQTKLTQAIFTGLKRYFWDYPPQGTRMEALAGMNQHLVRAGESLPKIAARYHVTVAALKSANHLSNVSLKPGQKLSIPAIWA